MNDEDKKAVPAAPKQPPEATGPSPEAVPAPGQGQAPDQVQAHAHAEAGTPDAAAQGQAPAQDHTPAPGQAQPQGAAETPRLNRAYSAALKRPAFGQAGTDASAQPQPSASRDEGRRGDRPLAADPAGRAARPAAGRATPGVGRIADGTARAPAGRLDSVLGERGGALRDLLARSPGWRRFGLFVLLPTLLCALYLFLISADIYVSQTQFAIRNANRPQASPNIIAGVGLMGTDLQEAEIVRNYIQSMEILNVLDSEFKLRDLYGLRGIDFLSAVSPRARAEDLLDYYRSSIVDVSVDDRTGIVTVNVSAFDPQTAKRIADRIVELSEKVVNGLSERARNDAVAFARRETEAAEQRLVKAQVDLRLAREQQKDIDPRKTAESIMTVVTNLESELGKARAELASLVSNLRSDSPQVRTAQARIEALEQEIAANRARLASTDPSALINIVSAIESAEIMHQFAEREYSSTMATLEEARAEAARQQLYLATYVQPNLPDDSTLPQRGLSLLAVFMGLTLVYAIGSLTIAAIQEHMV